MSFFAGLQEKWASFCVKTEPTRMKIKTAYRKTARFLRVLWAYVYKLRGALLSVPVAIAAIWLACKNLAELPDNVGLVLQSTGEFSLMVGKGAAVLCPLLVTALCLVLVLCSKRTLYPWLISVFSLTLPILIQILNIYPA